MADDKETGFKVSDRRQFNADGTPRESLVDNQTPADEAGSAGQNEAARVISFPGDKSKERGTAAKPAPGPSGAGEQPLPADQHRLPEASLEGLINMLAVEAVMHLGLIEGPMGGRSVDLEAARHVIDMLGVVQNKTQGNLTDEEAELLENVLADLRMQFVGISRGR